VRKARVVFTEVFIQLAEQKHVYLDLECVG